MRREQAHLPKAKNIIIKKSKKNNSTKFKLRTPKYLLTLKVDDRQKAEAIMESIPSSKYLFLTHFADICSVTSNGSLIFMFKWFIDLKKDHIKWVEWYHSDCRNNYMRIDNHGESRHWSKKLSNNEVYCQVKRAQNVSLSVQICDGSSWSRPS